MNQVKENVCKINVLHLVHSLAMGGAEVALIHYIRALGISEYSHFVYCYSLDGPVRKKIESLGIPVCMVKDRASIKNPLRFGITLLKLMLNLIAFIRRHHIGVIVPHSGGTNQLGVVVGKMCHLAAFPTVHSTRPFEDDRSKLDFRVHLNKAVNAVIYRVADRVLAVSEEIKDIIQRTYGLNSDKILVLKNGIIPEDNTSEPADLEKEFPFSYSKLKLIAVGRLVPLKGYDILVLAAAELVNQGFNDFIILIAGEGEERTLLENLIRDLAIADYVKLLGLRHDILALMKASDLFIMPSLYEGLSIAMIEAMSCGLPILGSDVPGLRDHIDADKNGFLFPYGGYKTLAQQITLLSNEEDLRIKLSLGAKMSFQKQYDMRLNIKPLDLLLREYATKMKNP